MVFNYQSLEKKLLAIMEKPQAEAEMNLILEDIGFSKKDLWINKTPNKEQEEKIEKYIEKRLKKRIPIQYILGYSYFMGEKFLVTPDVLIPRPETELLIEQAIRLKGETLLDIGTGSGCIAIMTKCLSPKSVTACDISLKALKIAKINAENLNTEIEFIHSDLFSNINKKFDIIVSNPPYIPIEEKNSLEAEVKDNEPHLALFTNDKKGIEFYEKIIINSKNYLNKNGILIFEAGAGQVKFIENIFKENAFKNIKIIKDLSGIERIILAQT